MSEIINDKQVLHDFWERQYAERPKPNADQNAKRSTDFLSLLDSKYRVDMKHHVISNAFRESKTIIDVGCGTGEFCSQLKSRFPHLNVSGVDISESAIEIAKTKGNIDFVRAIDVLNEDLSELVNKDYDTAYIADVLEHFKDPYAMIDRVFTFAKQVLILSPYNQGKLDAYTTEGGQGHAFRFDENSMNRYEVVSQILFTTPAWQHVSVEGEIPTQIAYLIQPKS